MNKVRLKYEKNNEVKYIGHLDTITMFDRAFRRSGIDIKFSNGFNKRACFVFALPTGAGIESKCEYMEFGVLDESLDLNLIKECLNKVLPNGFNIVDISLINDKKSIMAKVIESEYNINIYTNNIEVDYEKILKILSKDEILVIKKSKDDEVKWINIKDNILNININKLEEMIQINLKSKAGSNSNLRPEYIVQAIENENIIVLDYEIIRTNLILDE